MSRYPRHTTSNGHIVDGNVNHDPCLRCGSSRLSIVQQRCLPGIVVHVGDRLSASYWGHTHYVPVRKVDGHPLDGNPCGECTLARDRDHGGPTAWSTDIDGDFTAFRSGLESTRAT